MQNSDYIESKEAMGGLLLSEILSTAPIESEASYKMEVSSNNTSPQVEEIILVDIDAIRTDPHQPRKFFDDDSINTMAESLKEISMINPLIVFLRDGEYTLVAGEMRLRAAKYAGWPKVPCRVIKQDPMKVALAENFVRNDLTAVEEAEALKEAEAKGLTHAEIAKVAGKSRNTVTEIIAIADLPDYIKNECRNKRNCSKSGLIELSRIKDPKKLKKAYDSFRKSGFVRESARKARKSAAVMTEAQADNFGSENDVNTAAQVPETKSEAGADEVSIATGDGDVEMVEFSETTEKPVEKFSKLLMGMIDTYGASEIKVRYGRELKDLRNCINEILES